MKDGPFCFVSVATGRADAAVDQEVPHQHRETVRPFVRVPGQGKLCTAPFVLYPLLLWAGNPWTRFRLLLLKRVTNTEPFSRVREIVGGSFCLVLSGREIRGRDLVSDQTGHHEHRETG